MILTYSLNLAESSDARTVSNWIHCINVAEMPKTTKWCFVNVENTGGSLWWCLRLACNERPRRPRSKSFFREILKIDKAVGVASSDSE